MYHTTTYPSPVGLLTLACDCDNLVGLWIEGQKYHGGSIRETQIENSSKPALIAAIRWLDRYFAGEKPAVSELSLAPTGSEFRQRVLEILCGIPYGETVTYSCIAKRMAYNMGRASMSCRAVGGAVSHNPISIIIPCHRVIGSKGNLVGYAGGIETKIKLLELEGVDISGLYAPANVSHL